MHIFAQKIKLGVIVLRNVLFIMMGREIVQWHTICFCQFNFHKNVIFHNRSKWFATWCILETAGGISEEFLEYTFASYQGNYRQIRSR